MRWIVGAGTHGCWLGTYESAKQDSLARFVRPGMKVLDIGANAGFYTLAFSRLVGETGHVWALEPFAGNVAYLLAHIRHNRLRNASVIQAAVGDRDGMTGFQVGDSDCTGHIHDVSPYKIPVVSLDGLVTDGILPAPGLIKMDIEGAESAALEGARRLLAEKKSVFFIALHGEVQKRKCMEMLLSNSYRIFLMDGTEIRERHVAHCDEIYAVPNGFRD
jgi:FkbM family methyltransferase